MRLGQARFQFLDLAAIRFLGLFLHPFHHRERPVQRGAAAHADEVAVPRQLLDHALRETQVAVRLDDDSLSEQVLHLDAHGIKNHVAVANQDHHAVRGRFLERIVRLGLGLLFPFLLVSVVLLFGRLVARFPVGEGGFEFTGQTDGQGVFFVGRLEILVAAAKLGHDLVDQLGVPGCLEQYRLLQSRRRCARKSAGIGQQQIVQLTGEHVLRVHRVPRQ